jgi:hypothetical protein
MHYSSTDVGAHRDIVVYSREASAYAERCPRGPPFFGARPPSSTPLPTERLMRSHGTCTARIA